VWVEAKCHNGKSKNPHGISKNKGRRKKIYKARREKLRGPSFSTKRGRENLKRWFVPKNATAKEL